MQCSKNLVGVWESQHQHQDKAQIRRAGKAQHQHQIRAGSQHRQQHCTGRAEAVFRQGVLESNLSAQCCYSVSPIRVQPKVRLLPSEVRLLLGPSAFQNEPPSEPDGSLRNGSVDTRGELRLPPGFSIWQRTGQKAAPLTPRIQNQGHTNNGHCQGRARLR